MWLGKKFGFFSSILPSTFCVISGKSLLFSKLHFMFCSIRGWLWTFWPLAISPCIAQYIARPVMLEPKPEPVVRLHSYIVTRVLSLNLCTCSSETGWLIPVLGEHRLYEPRLCIHRVWEEKEQFCKNACTSKSNFLTLRWGRTSD